MAAAVVRVYLSCAPPSVSSGALTGPRLLLPTARHSSCPSSACCRRHFSSSFHPSSPHPLRGQSLWFWGNTSLASTVMSSSRSATATQEPIKMPRRLQGFTNIGPMAAGPDHTAFVGNNHIRIRCAQLPLRLGQSVASVLRAPKLMADCSLSEATSTAN
eukprot:GHVS01052948.1.p2 GENE.GHVS01052948.1~~GHVS01052948.1.p2  ORF type:complete len:159 (-),score=21.85 GHVS01052948.1:1223-1699(-)